MKNQTPNIAVLEDDLYFRTDISRKLRDFGTTHQSTSLEDFEKLIENQEINIAFLDLDLSHQEKKEGLQAIKLCLEKGILPIILTSHEDRETIQQAYKLGCAYYFSKTDFQDNYQHLVGGIFKSLNTQKWDNFFSKTYLTQNETLQTGIKFLLENSHNKNQNILLLGPTGVGKSKLAKAIHNQNNKDAPFIHVNLSEIPESLLESQLFGHKKGSFTGALADFKGLIQQANGGTLFLDEIGTIPLSTQKKLLRVIEEKIITPLGSEKSIKVDFQLITATCDDLAKLVEENDFRLDLYFRIKGIELDIPPLNKRKDDIPFLIDYFISLNSRKIAFSETAWECLLDYKWYGNVREVESLVKELTNSAKGLITEDDIPTYIKENTSPLKKSAVSPLSSGFLNREMREHIKKEGLPALVNAIEKEAMQEWQERCQNKTNEVIRQLQISKSLFYRIVSDLKSESIS